MKARIWKDRLSGAWCYAIPRVRAGAESTWASALERALVELDAYHAAVT